MNEFVTAGRTNLEKFFPAMKELRPNLSERQFFKIYAKANKINGYKLVELELEQRIIATMGFRVLYDYVHGKHLYIDDLVTVASERSKGHGAKLLKHAEKIAADLECKSLRLCTGIQNELAKNFYKNNGWTVRAIVFKKKLVP